MLTGADGGPDGKKRRYLEHPDQWRAFDPELFDLLASVSKEPIMADLVLNTGSCRSVPDQ
jgi:hypothetical protein